MSAILMLHMYVPSIVQSSDYKCEARLLSVSDKGKDTTASKRTTMVSIQPSLQTLILVFSYALLFSSVMCQYLPESLQPPLGNSLKMSCGTSRGQYVFKCQNKKWVGLSASAELQSMKASGTKSSLGNFSLVHSEEDPSYAGKWHLKIGDAAFAESGSEFSVVAGNSIASSGSQTATRYSVLAEASFHQNDIIYKVSYIQCLYKMGSLPQKCSENSETSIQFEAEFRFYTQDSEPPKMPASIEVRNGQMVEGFFCKGTAGYIFDGKQWQRDSIQGKLYNLPGGYEVGSFYEYLKNKPDKHSNGGSMYLQTNNPNGWLLVGKRAASSVTVQPNSLAWSLFQVTSSTGNVTLLGPFKYFQLLGTRGGVPTLPSITAEKGLTWTGQFSAQFWIYK
eukprot:TRINITY_DN2449_c0_g1_i1.p1 TRINITY_DN2449_c0_g1~~TRINITY_DN2449_c0_g1_i1.p1  ORF type:complete len:392 (-),score=61.31 TRINITY_DN2449_c0_g1_i1:417-1592(-)